MAAEDENSAIDALIGAVTERQWDRLRDLATQLSADPASAGSWVRSEQQADGSWRLGYFETSPALGHLLDSLYDADLVTGVFDWPEWWSSCEYQGGANIETAPAADLVRFITTVVRGDRFNDGVLGEYVANGALPAAISRLAGLAGGSSVA